MKFCRDCKWASEDAYGMNCQSEKVVIPYDSYDLVTGTLNSKGRAVARCENQRSPSKIFEKNSNSRCGVEGKWFEQKGKVNDE